MLTASPRRWRLAALLSLLLSLAALAWPRAAHSTGGYSLRFYGHGSSAPDLDRVKIRIDPATPADVGATDFTIEVWLKAGSGNNAGAITPGANVNWINGNIFLDRDIYAAPAYGDFGLSLGAGRVAFGVETGQGARTIVGTSDLRDGAWHHVAVTRNATTGQMRLFVDGVQASRQAGSTLKPFLYGLALEERRLTAASLLDDATRTPFPSPEAMQAVLGALQRTDRMGIYGLLQQVNLTKGTVEMALRMMEAEGAVSVLTSGGALQCVEQASTLVGQPSLRALNAADRLWQPMSPNTPVPKSHQPRHANGWYAG